MRWSTKKDMEMLSNMPMNELCKLFFLHIKKLLRVDGLYFLGIEKNSVPNRPLRLRLVAGKLWENWRLENLKKS